MINYRKEVDGLRALAVVPVILYHAGVTAFDGGYVGVDIFFVISGYLITNVIMREKEEGSFSLIRFYERRARRILPALFFVMLVCVPFAWFWMLPYQLVSFAKSILAVALFLSNILFWRETGYFNTANETKPLLHTWSLSVEEQYYLVFPLFVILAWRFSRRWMPGVLMTITAGSFALAEWSWRTHPEAAFYLAPTRAWEILLGALIAIYQSRGDAAVLQWQISSMRGQIGQWASVAGVGLILLAVVGFDRGTPAPSYYTLIPTAGAGLIIVFATSETVVGRLLAHDFLSGIGLISYSAYLWHQPLFAFARIRSADKPGVLLLGSLIALSLVLAYASWRFVEKPFRDRRLVSRTAIFAGSGVMACILIGVGFVGQLDRGFLGRFSKDERSLVDIDPSVQGQYVSRRFDDLILAPFVREKVKVFIVGDSFAEDFVNCYAENGYLKAASVSTYHISARWGAIISKEDFSGYVDRSEREACLRHGGRFDSPEVRLRLKQCDVVILVSYWQEWQVQYLNETVQALQQLGAKKVLVVGRKDFGHVAPLQYLGVSDRQKRQLRNNVSKSTREINMYIKAHLDPDVFVDFQSSVCGDDETSPVFTENIKLISYDGVHLTADGARYVGKRLFRDRALACLIPPFDVSETVP